MVRARSGAPLEYVVLGPDGQPVDEIIEIRSRSVSQKKTTCWECGKDSAGNTHCWKIPCPVIVGPWNPGKVLATGFVLE
jgi:hypothetical protein